MGDPGMLQSAGCLEVKLEESNQTIPTLSVSVVPGWKAHARRLYVSMIPNHFTDTKVKSLFEQYGSVMDVRFYVHNRNEPGRFAFVTFLNSADAALAKRKLDGTMHGKMRLLVRYAHDQMGIAGNTTKGAGNYAGPPLMALSHQQRDTMSHWMSVQDQNVFSSWIELVISDLLPYNIESWNYFSAAYQTTVNQWNFLAALSTPNSPNGVAFVEPLGFLDMNGLGSTTATYSSPEMLPYLALMTTPPPNTLAPPPSPLYPNILAQSPHPTPNIMVQPPPLAVAYASRSRSSGNLTTVYSWDQDVKSFALQPEASNYPACVANPQSGSNNINIASSYQGRRLDQASSKKQDVHYSPYPRQLKM